jgi:hypothetical protein
MTDPSDDNPIHKLSAFFPLPDADTDYLEKYKRDLIYHYEDGFFNLALFSFHYLYMTLLHIYLLKYHRFDMKIVNSCRCGHPPVSVLSPHIYADVRDEKGRIHLFGGLDKQLKNQHTEIVRRRDAIAHSTGALVDKVQFDGHIRDSCAVLEYVKIHALDEMLKNHNFQERAGILNAMCGAEDDSRIYEYQESLLALVQDFYLSDRDLEHLANTGVLADTGWLTIHDITGI